MGPAAGDDAIDPTPLASAARRGSRLRSEALAFVELLALSGFAVAQPLLDVFGRAPEVFVFHGARGADLVWFALAVVLVPPIALWGLGAAVGASLGARSRQVAHVAVAGLLVALVALQAVRRSTPVTALPLATASAAIGVLGAVAMRARVARLWLRAAAPAPALFAGLFLLTSPVAPLLSADSSRARPVAVTAQRTPVVMVVLDELPTASLLDPSGGIDELRFPNLADLASDAVFFRNHTAVGEYTQIAMTAALTGRYPEHAPTTPSWAAHPDTLFRLLGGAFDMHVFESLTALCPPAACATTAADRDASVAGSGRRGVWPLLGEARDLYPQLIGLHDPPAAPAATLGERFEVVPAPVPEGGVPRPTLPADLNPDGRAHAQPVRVRAFLESIEAGSGEGPPGFWFLHLVLPHHPYRLFPDGRAYALPEYTRQMPGLLGSWIWVEHEWPALAARQRHLLQTRYVDAVIGDILSTLRSESLYDDALVVVTADHGASFVPGASFRAPDERTAPGVAWVPLIVKLPGGDASVVDDRNVEQVDLLATVADVLDVDVPWPTDGVSAFAARPRAPARKTFVRSPSLVSRGGYATLTLDARAGFASVLGLPLTSSGSDPDLGILRAGPFGALLGRSLDSFASAPPFGRPARVDGLDAFDDVDLAGELPAFVRGRLEADAVLDAAVVVALNGRVAGVSPTFRYERDAAAFTVLIPPSSFRDGRNELELFLLDDAEGHVALAPVDVAR